MCGLGHAERRLRGVMAITRSGKRTGADKDECPICMGNRPDVSEPEAYTCVAAMTGNVHDCGEYDDPEVVAREQRNVAREWLNGWAAGCLLSWQYPQWFIDEEVAAGRPWPR